MSIVDIGDSDNDGTGDPLRVAFAKINAELTDLRQAIASETTPEDVMRVVVWDADTESYPPRPSAQVVRYIGPLEPGDWTEIDEWRLYGDPPSIAPDAVASLVQWLKADDIIGLSDAEAVSSWPASEGGNATQATGTRQPTYRVGVANSLPVVRFDGSNDFLSFAGIGAALSEFTILTVVRPSSVSGEKTILSQDITGFSDDLLFGVDPEGLETPNGLLAGVMQKSSGSVRVVVSDPNAPSTTSLQVSGLRYDTSNFEIFRNGVPSVGSISASAFSLTDRTWNIGRNPQDQRYFGGDIAEVVIYSTALDDNDLARVISGLKQKYDI